MIVIQRRTDHADPFFGYHGHHHRRHHHHVPIHHSHPFGVFGRPVYRHRPSPSFYSSPFDQLEAAMVSPYHIRPRPRPRPRFEADALLPVVLLPWRLMDGERNSSKQPTEPEADSASTATAKAAPTAHQEPKDEANKGAEDSHAEEDKPETNTKEIKGEEKNQNKEHKEQVSEEDIVDFLRLFQPRHLAQCGPRGRRGCRRRNSNRDAQIQRAEDAVTISIYVAGFDATDLSLTYDDGALTVSGKRSDENGGQSSFVRRVPLDERRFDVDGVSARLVDGVLNVRVPRRAASAPRSINIVADAENAKSNAESSSADAKTDDEPETEVGEIETEKEEPNAESHSRGENVAEAPQDAEGEYDLIPDAESATKIEKDGDEKKKNKTVNKVKEEVRRDDQEDAEENSLGDESSQKAPSVSVKTVSSDDEDDEDEETYEVV